MARGLLIIKTLTPTHPGAGTSTGAIDLMLQREVTTDFPFIQGSSLKGAIRAYIEAQPVEDTDLAKELLDFANQKGDEELKEELKNITPEKMTVSKARSIVQKLKGKLPESEKGEINKFEKLYGIIDKVFGPYEPGSEFRKGSLIISDASLLFYPVRSLKGLYAIITCPEILRRLKMPHINADIPENLFELEESDKAIATTSSASQYQINGRVYFEDLNFSVKPLQDSNFDWINKNNGLENDIKNRLFIVHDDVFQYFVKFATMVTSRNKIDYKTGVVATGALWTEEHLPPETYLFSYLEDDGNPVDENKTAFQWLEEKISSKVIHLGGDETVGKGFVELKVKELNEEGKNGDS